MELRLLELIVGVVVGSFLTALTLLVLIKPGLPAIDESIAKLVISEGRAECKDRDRPFHIEGAGAFVAVSCGPKQ